MTAPNLLDELEKIVALSEKATPGPWDVRHDDDELRIHAADTKSHGFTLEMRIASDINGYAKQRLDGSWDYSESERNAELIAQSVNFLRTHHATLADMAKRLEAAERDAARIDWLESKAHMLTWNDNAEHVAIRAEDGAEGTGESWREAIDAAIDAAQEGEAG